VYRGFGIYSMTKTGGRRKIFLTRAKAASNLAADQHLLSPCLSPFFGVKFHFNYGLCFSEMVILFTEKEGLKFHTQNTETWESTR
jgi:hypothetical protein